MRPRPVARQARPRARRAHRLPQGRRSATSRRAVDRSRAPSIGRRCRHPVRTTVQAQRGPTLRGMNRSGAARALEAIFTLLAAAALPLVVIGAMSALPAMTLDATPVAWLPTALAGALALTATFAALAWLVSGLGRGSVSSIAAAGSSAAVAGGAVAWLAGGAVAWLAGATALAAPIAAAATFALVAVLADLMPPIAERGARLGMTAMA